MCLLEQKSSISFSWDSFGEDILEEKTPRINDNWFERGKKNWKKCCLLHFTLSTMIYFWPKLTLTINILHKLNFSRKRIKVHILLWTGKSLKFRKYKNYFGLSRHQISTIIEMQNSWKTSKTNAEIVPFKIDRRYCISII